MKESREPADDAVDAMEIVPPTDDASDADVGEPGEGEGLAGAATGPVPLEPPESAVARLKKELGASQDQYLRLAAEFDNFRKRVARERVELTDRAHAAFAMRLLEVLDDLDRLVDQDKDSTGHEVLHEAIVLVDRKLRKELGAHGLERIFPEGERFDPALHEAVSVVAPPTPEQDNHVSAVFQAGYQYKGSLIRPARVQVFIGEGQG